MQIRGVIPVYWHPKGQKLQLLGVAGWVYTRVDMATAGAMTLLPLPASMAIAGVEFSFLWIERLAQRLSSEHIKYWSLAKGVSATRVKGNVVYLSTRDMNKIIMWSHYQISRGQQS